MNPKKVFQSSVPSMIFFYRQLQAGARPIQEGLVSPADGKILAFENTQALQQFFVKGLPFTIEGFLKDQDLAQTYAGASLVIIRLAPPDYHRFHFPDDGHVLASWRIPGALHSVNPWALTFREDIFMINERQVTILETHQFGKLAYVEVGATCVGKIKQTYTGDAFARGDEKGMFLFGGSTVIVIGEKGRWEIDAGILGHTTNGVETYLKMGQALGQAM